MGPYNPLDKQLEYNPNTGEVTKCHVQPYNKVDEIVVYRDICDDTLLSLLVRSTKKLLSDDDLNLHSLACARYFSEAVQTRVTIRLTNRWRHAGSLSKVGGYYSARVSRYANSDSTFQLIRVVISGDVSENPGPNLKKPKCYQCFKTIARNHRIITCSSCDSTYHIKCGGVTPKQQKTITAKRPNLELLALCTVNCDFKQRRIDRITIQPYYR